MPKTVTDSKGRTSIVFEESPESLAHVRDASRTPDCWELKLGNANGTVRRAGHGRALPPAKGTMPSQMINVVVAGRENTLPDNTKWSCSAGLRWTCRMA